MRKTLSIAAVALMMAGSTAFACSGCGCSAKKTDKNKTECESKCKGGEKEEKKQTACHHSKKVVKEKKAA